MGGIKNYRRGYQFLDVFDIDDIEIIKRSGKLKSNMVSRYCSRSGKKIKTGEKRCNDSIIIRSYIIWIE